MITFAADVCSLLKLKLGILKLQYSIKVYTTWQADVVIEKTKTKHNIHKTLTL